MTNGMYKLPNWNFKDSKSKKYHIGVDMAASKSKDKSMRTTMKVKNGKITILNVVNVTPFCPICHSIEENVNYSENIKVCKKCQKILN